MLTVGKQLDSAKDSYDKAVGQLYSGKGNLIQQAHGFQRFGVSVQEALEIDHMPDLLANTEAGAGT
ncbi:MAG: recombination protein RmuC [Noviherbaspirillum sp.]|nr:recombination protein RmuC [Noviherbaspirillum sp.]